MCDSNNESKDWRDEEEAPEDYGWRDIKDKLTFQIPMSEVIEEERKKGFILIDPEEEVPLKEPVKNNGNDPFLRDLFEGLKLCPDAMESFGWHIVHQITNQNVRLSDLHRALKSL